MHQHIATLLRARPDLAPRLDRVNVALTLFGRGRLDDALRGHHPSGKKLTGLFDRALANYHDDDRAIFIYALTTDAVHVLPSQIQVSE